MKKTLIIIVFILVILVLTSSNINIPKANTQPTSKLNGKNIVFLGDSLTSKGETKKYLDYISDTTGANCVNYGVNGSTIARIEEDDKWDISFVKRYKDIIKDYPDSEYWDLIIVFGGINDYVYDVDISLFQDSLNEIVYELQSYYPKARIILMTPLLAKYGNMNFEKYFNARGMTLEAYRSIIREVARLQGCVVFETSFLSGLNPNNASVMKRFYDVNGDGVHPSQEGHRRIAVPLKNLLEGLVE